MTCLASTVTYTTFLLAQGTVATLMSDRSGFGQVGIGGY